VYADKRQRGPKRGATAAQESGQVAGREKMAKRGEYKKKKTKKRRETWQVCKGSWHQVELRETQRETT
jgi:hypothetical protein